jgi:hypothetical protein
MECSDPCQVSYGFEQASRPSRRSSAVGQLIYIKKGQDFIFIFMNKQIKIEQKLI